MAARTYTSHIDMTISIINPARIRETVGEIEITPEREIDTTIAKAQSAFAPWAASSTEDRASRLRDAAQALSQQVTRLATLFVRENGKPLKEAERDIQRSIELTQVIAEELPRWWKPELADPHQPIWTRRRPRGVTAVISPWNSPVLLSFKRFIPAIAAGNTVVIKPATNCPLTIMECVRIIAPFFPDNVIDIVTGSGKTAGEKLATDPRIRAIAFTGSTETGRRIMELASRTVKKVFLELGGNDAALILRDAQLDAPAIDRMTRAILRAAGQVCVAIKRIYVHESRYDELVDKLGASFDTTVAGDGLAPSTTMGPLNNKSQFEFVTGLLARCHEKNLRVQTKGKRLDPASWDDGYFVLPAIVLDANDGDEIVSCEQFGPVVPILKFANEDDAIARANATEFGLRASVWTADATHAAEVADRLGAGAVFYNNHGIFQDLHLEFPGVKQSGFGRESKVAGLDHYADSYGFAG
jgi:acyl-CoA reductase-like NAD-dependent aldehyde dehydrogenase